MVGRRSRLRSGFVAVSLGGSGRSRLAGESSPPAHPATTGKVGLGWVDFRVMRRTNASLGHDAKVDPKVSADQRGRGIGVSLDVYTKTSIEKKALAATKLEKSVLGGKTVRMPKRKVS